MLLFPVTSSMAYASADPQQGDVFNYIYEDDNIRAEATLSEASVLPEDTSFVVKTLDANSVDQLDQDLYQRMLTRLNEKATAEQKTLDGYIFYQMVFESNGEIVTPDLGNTTIEITYKTANVPESYQNSVQTGKALNFYQNTAEGLEDLSPQISLQTADEEGSLTALKYQTSTVSPLAVVWSEDQAVEAPVVEQEAPVMEEETPVVEEVPVMEEASPVVEQEEGATEKREQATDMIEDWNSNEPVVSFTDVAPLYEDPMTETSDLLQIQDARLFSSFNKSTLNQPSLLTQAVETTDEVTTRVDAEGLETSKSVSENTDGTWNINLEAFATGDVSVQTNTMPADIVLTFDTSGSMAYSLGNTTRMAALKSAANAFIDNVYANQTTTNASLPVDEQITHRIAITTFATDGTDRTNGFYELNASNVAALKAIVGGLSANGGTNTAGGLLKAQEYFTVNSDPSQVIRTDANPIEVLFTDGIPTFSTDASGDQLGGSGGDFCNDGAAQAIQYANQIKNNDINTATVYTIGIFGGADPDECPLDIGNTSSSYSEEERANGMMNYISSNYPEANATYTAGYDSWFGWNDGTMTVTPGTPASQSDGGYYLTTDNESGLNDIFDRIISHINVTTIDLGAEATLIDTITNEFILPASGANISVHKVAYIGRDGNDNWTFDEANAEDITSALTITQGADSIEITGFDYAANAVYDMDPTTGEVGSSGYKIVVTFTIDRSPSFYGGNAVPTNVNTSGIYDKNDTLVENFEEPAADVPILYEIDGTDQSIYITQVASSNDLLSLGTDGALNYTPDGSNNGFVNITYTLLDGTTEVASKTVLAGETLGAAVFSSDDLIGLTENKTYTLKASITSINTPALSGVADQERTASATVNVFKPTITATDTTLFLGETTNLEDRINDTINWTCPDHSSASLPSGAAPVLSYTFNQVSGTAIGSDQTAYEPIETSDLAVASVTANSQAILGYTTVIKAGDSTDDHDFTVNVVKGQIDLTKTINEQYTGIEQIKANQTFVFKIERFESANTSGTPEKTFYETIAFDANGNVTTKSAIAIKGLEKGYYVITEETEWSSKYTFNQASVDSNNPLATPITQNQVILPIGTMLSNDSIPEFYGLESGTNNQIATGTQAEVHFNNLLKTDWQWLSDSAGAINQFKGLTD